MFDKREKIGIQRWMRLKNWKLKCYLIRVWVTFRSRVLMSIFISPNSILKCFRDWYATSFWVVKQGKRKYVLWDGKRFWWIFFLSTALYFSNGITYFCWNQIGCGCKLWNKFHNFDYKGRSQDYRITWVYIKDYENTIFVIFFSFI